MRFPHLLPLGWRPFFEEHVPASCGWIPGRIVHENRELYQVQLGDQVVNGEITGRMRYTAVDKADLPAVGDWVLAQTVSADLVVIHEILPRQSCLMRRSSGGGGRQIFAANIDIAMIASSLNGDFNLRRLERYLIAIHESGARPWILLTKADLAEPGAAEEAVARVRALDKTCPVSVLSSQTGRGLEEFKEKLAPGMTGILVGSSGVGKSTLVNKLLGTDAIATREIRASDRRGRHTTTDRQLYRLPNGALMIDSPGVREFGLLDFEQGFDSIFGSLEALMAECRFSDCKHQSEPGCRIRQALAEGAIDEEQWRSYLKLQKEIAHETRKTDRAAAAAEKEKWRKIHIAQRKLRSKRE